MLDWCYGHDVPLTEESLRHIAGRIQQVQDFLQRPLVLENPSSYITFNESTISEPEFLRQLVKQTGCQLLLDVNNVYVTCFNSDADPKAYIEAFPCEAVVQLHLAGHQHCGTHIIDTHDGPVRDDVWALFQLAWLRCNKAAVLLEWDGNIPSFQECHTELLKAQTYMGKQNRPVNAITDYPKNRDAISNPVDFLVPEVMDKTVLEQQ